MRFDVKKYLFIGVEKERDAFFKEAQDAGVIHFIKSTLKPIKEESANVHNLTTAIKVLRGLPPTPQEETDEFDLAEGIATKILELQHHLEQLAEEERVNRLDISRVSPYGDFSSKEFHELEKETHRKFQFFFAKEGHKDDPELPEGLIYINTDHGLDYFLAINKQPVQYEKMIEMQIPHPLGELIKRREAILQDTRKTEVRLKSYAKYNRFLHHALIYTMNTFNLERAKYNADPRINGELFSVEGWVSITKGDALRALVSKSDIYAEEVEIEPEDSIPTNLENSGYNRVGQDVISVYDTPSHTDKDPSFWVLSFFALFFAMIVGDAGYGIVFLATAAYVRYKYKKKMRPLGARFVTLMFILGGATLFWGVMTNSIFGFHFSHDSPLSKFSLMHYLVEKKAAYHFDRKDKVYDYWVKEYPNLKEAKTPQQFLHGAVKKEHGFPTYEMVDKFSDNILMELALFVGVIHIMISFLRYLDRNWSGLGWIIFLVGCYLYFPVFVDGTSLIHFAFGIDPAQGAQDGYYLIWIGFGLAIGLAMLRHKIFGLLDAMHVIQIFADTMSYLRLYALGFAGAVVMTTVNEFAGSLNYVFGALLFLLGHATNILLAIMAGTIHGLRLNFLEWYHYSFEGGGKMFNPLRKLNYD